MNEILKASNGLSYRARLAEKGFVRFEIHALNSDKDLIKLIAKILAKNDNDAQILRSNLKCLLGL
ncbi:MAG: hypothetical protein J0L55_15435 [Caulobacterales bacterium]|nr:hypothetical protein [Caulobacterales bacterium]